ncbi:MAG: hypothetical protein V1676_07120 [Candidatus Diapherotrites archaeon]
MENTGKGIFEAALKENLIKNAAILALAFLFYPQISAGLGALDSTKIGDFLLIISMLLVTACFANFALSYGHLRLEQFGYRMFSHFSTFVFMLLIAFLLEAIVIGTIVVYPSLAFIVMVFSALLYLGVALYDFWDFFRAFSKPAN